MPGSLKEQRRFVFGGGRRDTVTGLYVLVVYAR